MAVNKVVMNTPEGEQTLIDLTNDSVTPETLAEGATAHDASGQPVTGKKPTSVVLYTAQTLTKVEQAQARMNIGLPVLEPAEDDIPKVFIDGTIPTTKDDVLAEMEYISKTERFKAYLKIKCQGSSSMQYNKKNFTIKMYSDEARETKLKKAFKDWGHESHKYVLKANWIDHSHARNIVGARIWDEVVSSRPDYDTLPEEMRNSPRNGAVDGFPIKVYTNGAYQGVYTWNIGKDDWMWGMDEDNANHSLLCAEVNNNGEEVDTAANFRALWTFEGDRTWDWEVEVGEKTDAVVSSLNALITCIKDTDDDTFKATIGNYLDVQSAIDYWIHQYIICGLDGLGKNLLLATYDGTKWICGAYDMDSTFGLHYGGGYFVSAQFRCPEDYQENRSLLWERISTLYADEVLARYTELRKTTYSYANLFTHFERFMDVIGLDLYAEDLTIYADIPNAEKNNIQQIRNFIRDRLYYCDLQFGLITEPEVEKTVLVENYTVSDTAATYTLYDGTINWDTQSLVFELEAINTECSIAPFMYIGSNISSVDDDYSFSISNNADGSHGLGGFVQSGNVNGEWGCTGLNGLSNLVGDWSNFKIEINKEGIFVDDQSVENATITNAEAHAILFERLMKNTSLQIGKLTTNESTGLVKFKSIYTYQKFEPVEETDTYGLDNGQYEWTVGDSETSNLFLEVTNNNHVKLYSTGVISKGAVANISNPTKNTAETGALANLYGGDKRFSLASGDEVRVVITHASGSTSNNPMSIYIADADSYITILKDTSGDVDTTYTMTEDVDVVGIGMYAFFWSDDASGVFTMEYDIAIYVNGVQYV